ncbi:1,4-alpha-glucan branching protein GlgB [Clavibacter michiganensis]|uniref:1,4-alpha-glucan branching protein GlgB n=1 Tax=Clavibacter michiganensis TaxID=28447 RepID=UPI0013030BF0|nr:1,4-alpha-glucan branching protein GlgB [Clavibacter michiganensis]
MTDMTDTTPQDDPQDPQGELPGADVIVPPAADADIEQGADVVVPAEDGAADEAPASASASASGPIRLPEVADDDLRAVAEGVHSGPHSVLGQHPVAIDGVDDDLVVVRALRPLAEAVSVILSTGARVALAHVAHGVWQGAHVLGLQDYQVEARYSDGGTWTSDDPYRFLPTVGDLDLYLFGEGRHERLWDVLGAHHREHWGVAQTYWGVSFSVWAPHARAVRVIGGFNGWDGVQHAMRRLDGNGVWELFVPGVEPGVSYKFEILTQAGQWIEKADPMARMTEVPPATASRVETSGYQWDDAAWLEERAARDPHDSPMSVYEMHLGSWRPGLGYREVAGELVAHLQELSYTHVEFLPLAEHPFGGSWGYQVSGYYAPTSRFGSPDDLKFLIDSLHRAGIGVIVDWVPAHFPKDAFALAQFDGQPLYEHTDPRRGEQQDWGTLVFDFGHSQVRNFLVANALYWFEEFHIDGLRVDAVASMLYLDYSREEGQWLPNVHGGRENLEAISFLQEVNATAYRTHPGIVMIAEESTSFPGVTRPTSDGGLGFGLKWNMGWMHDTLDYTAVDPMYRAYHHGQITFSMVYAYTENFLLPISHDEVVHGKGSLVGKMPGDHWQKLANVRAYLSFMWSHPGKQLLFMGQEFGQPSEWSEERGLDWWILDQPVHRALFDLVGSLNRTYIDTPALWALDNDPAGFEWIDAGDAGRNVLAFLRRDREGNQVAVVHNFSGAPIQGYRLGLPQAGVWEEILNTDAEQFGGSGVGNLGAVHAGDEGWHGRPASAELTLPPLAGLWLRMKQDPADLRPVEAPAHAAPDADESRADGTPFAEPDALPVLPQSPDAQPPVEGLSTTDDAPGSDDGTPRVPTV